MFSNNYQIIYGDWFAWLTSVYLYSSSHASLINAQKAHNQLATFNRNKSSPIVSGKFQLFALKIGRGNKALLLKYPYFTAPTHRFWDIWILVEPICIQRIRSIRSNLIARTHPMRDISTSLFQWIKPTTTINIKHTHTHRMGITCIHCRLIRIILPIRTVVGLFEYSVRGKLIKKTS